MQDQVKRLDQVAQEYGISSEELIKTLLDTLENPYYRALVKQLVAINKMEGQ